MFSDLSLRRKLILLYLRVICLYWQKNNLREMNFLRKMFLNVLPACTLNSFHVVKKKKEENWSWFTSMLAIQTMWTMNEEINFLVMLMLCRIEKIVIKYVKNYFNLLICTCIVVVERRITLHIMFSIEGGYWRKGYMSENSILGC